MGSIQRISHSYLGNCKIEILVSLEILDLFDTLENFNSFGIFSGGSLGSVLLSEKAPLLKMEEEQMHN